MKKISVALCLMMALAIGFTFTAERSAAASKGQRALKAYESVTSGKKGYVSIQHVKGGMPWAMLWTNKRSGKRGSRYLASVANLFVYKNGRVKQVNTTFRMEGRKVNALKTKKKFKIGLIKKKLIVPFKGGAGEFTIKNTKIKGKVIWQSGGAYYCYKVANGKASKAKRVGKGVARKFFNPIIYDMKYPLFAKISW